MDLMEILKAGGTALVVIILTLIEIPKLKINFWGLIGRAINKEQTNKIDKMQESVDNITKRLDEHIKDEEEYRAEEARQRILTFNNEVLRHQAHTRESWDEILSDIDSYEDYCDEHPSYSNNKAELTIKHLKQVYAVRLEQNDFL